MELNIFQFFGVICSVTLATILSFSYVDQLTLINSLFKVYMPKEPKLLTVGIMSARENFDLRKSIRKTWMQLLDENSEFKNKVVVKFVVGGSPCDIHKSNRKSHYSCDSHILSPLTDSDNIPLFSASKNDPDCKFGVKTIIYHNATISIRHPIVINRLGLHIGVPLKDDPVEVFIYDDVRMTSVVSAHFSSVDTGVTNGVFRYQTVSPILLPKDFEGSLRVKSNHITINKTGILNNHDCLINNSGGSVDVDYFDQVGFSDITMTSKLLLSSMYFSIHEKEYFDMRIKDEDKLNKIHQINNKLTTQRLTSESEMHGDIVFSDVIDVYRNLPIKLLKFHQWVSNNVETDYIMKTDDDCFVDLEKILIALENAPSVSKLWWSNFRSNWLVERYGKWQEKVFPGHIYPTFACGSGSIVSRDLSNWLAVNSDLLQPYQGEDVSMGIWLSAIGPNFLIDDNWKCDKNCDKNALVIPELTSEEMQWFWDNKKSCGNLCGC